MNKMVTPKFGVGAPLRRKEDQPLITGQGIYTGDYRPEGCLHGVMVYSAMAHAKISVENASDVSALDGVHLVLTGGDVEGFTLPTMARLKQIDGTDHWLPPQPLLCKDEVRHVGDAIAFIVAEAGDHGTVESPKGRNRKGGNEVTGKDDQFAFAVIERTNRAPDVVEMIVSVGEDSDAHVWLALH